MRNMEPFSDFSFPRAAEIYSACLELFEGNRERAWKWLNSRVRGLGYARPIDYAKTEAGAMEVQNLIGRLEDGVFS
jgi:putative toxin-antitoxin system antitoxin component (TIGR02293 family)